MEPDNLLVGKKCCRCKKEYEPDTRYFTRDSNSKDGFSYNCKECDRLRRIKKRKPEVKSITLPFLGFEGMRYAREENFGEWPKTYYPKRKYL